MGSPQTKYTIKIGNQELVFQNKEELLKFSNQIDPFLGGLPYEEWRKKNALNIFSDQIKQVINKNSHRFEIPMNNDLIDDLSEMVILQKSGKLENYQKILMKNKIVNEILIGKMGIDPKDKLIESIIEKIMHTKDIKYLRRTLRVLMIMVEYGIEKDKAVEFFNGAHFIIKDNAELFKKLRVVEGCEPRFSSHFKNTRLEEYGINCGRVIPEILFLDTFEEGDKSKKPCYTHFQVEASPWRGKSALDPKTYKAIVNTPQNLEHVPHSVTYFAYKTYRKLKGKSAKNLGAYGWSKHDDKNPIELSKPKKL